MNEENRQNKITIQKILIIAVVVIFLVTIWNMNHSMNNLQQEMSVLRQEVNSQQNIVSSQISGISANVEASLKKENSIIADYSYQIQSDKFNREDKTIPLSLTVRPKEHTDGLKTTFILETEDGKIISAPGTEREAFTYTAEVVVPICSYLKLSVALDDGTLQRLERLEELYRPFEGLFMKVDSYISDMTISSSGKNKLQFSGTIETTFSSNIDGSNYPVGGEVRIEKNGTVLRRLPIQIDEESGSGAQEANGAPPPAVAEFAAGSSGSYYTRFNETINYKDLDQIEFIVIVKDNNGYQHKQTIHSVWIDKHGNTYPTGISNEVVVE